MCSEWNIPILASTQRPYPFDITANHIDWPYTLSLRYPWHSYLYNVPYLPRARLWSWRQCDFSKRRALITQRQSVNIPEGLNLRVKLIHKFKNFITYSLGGGCADFGRTAKMYFRKMDCGYVKKIRIWFSGGILSYCTAVEHLAGHSALSWTTWKIVLFMPSFGLWTILLRDDKSHYIINPFRRTGFVWGCERNVKSW